MPGIYVTTELADESCKLLKEFVEKLPLPTGSRMKEKEYHITLAYSKEGFNYNHSDKVHGALCKPVRWDIFGVDEHVLVLVMESETLQERFQELCAQGYKCKFPDYKPHITVGMAPPEGTDIGKYPVPEFGIKVLREYSEPLDDGFTYNPQDMCEAYKENPLSFLQFIANIS